MRTGLRIPKPQILAWLALLLAACLCILLILAPSEARLGWLIKLVFVHGALVWTGLVMFSLAGGLGLVALLARRPAWYRGVQTAATASLIVWLVYSLSAILVTGLAWGQWVAWNEPRVRVTGLILVAAVLVSLIAHLVNARDFTAAANTLMGFAVWVAVRQAEVIRDPVDPIGGSGSAAIQGFFLGTLLTVAGLAATLLAWLWLGAERSAARQGAAARLAGIHLPQG